jgi:hypothetical protein
MPHKLVIDFNVPDDPNLVSDRALFHTIRNFEEDLDRQFIVNGQAVVVRREIDPTHPSLSFTLTSNRHSGSVLASIKKKLSRWRLAGIASISTS